MRININNVKMGNPINLHTIDDKTQARFLDKKVEAFSYKNKTFISMDECESANPLISAVHLAFANHLGLEFGPDLVFNIILQGISEHVNLTSEKYRYLFVNHEGIKQLVTVNNGLIKGNWDNSWDESILDLGKQIYSNLSTDYSKDLLSTRYSTTSLTESIAHISTFMDIVKNYFEYTVMTFCGIPWIDVKGTKEDWVLLSTKIQVLLIELGLTDWNNKLQAIIKEFIGVFDGLVNKSFWNGIYYYNGPEGSGGVSTITGWITDLFYNIKSKQPKDFPCSIRKTPFNWEYYQRIFKMNLISGIVGISIVGDTGALKPEIGWLIAEV